MALTRAEFGQLLFETLTRSQASLDISGAFKRLRGEVEMGSLVENKDDESVLHASSVISLQLKDGSQVEIQVRKFP